MEKNGLLPLTKKELEDFRKTGKVPARLERSWDLSDEDIREIILSGTYQLLE